MAFAHYVGQEGRRNSSSSTEEFFSRSSSLQSRGNSLQSTVSAFSSQVSLAKHVTIVSGLPTRSALQPSTFAHLGTFSTMSEPSQDCPSLS